MKARSLALLGTARGSGLPEAEADAAPMLSARSDSVEWSWLLQCGLEAVLAEAGRLPLPAPSLPEPLPAPGRHLPLELSRGLVRARHLHAWAAARLQGVELHPLALPGLLATGAGPLVAAAGPRAAWLATQNPQWRAAIPAPLDPLRAWEEGLERASALAALRAREPALGRRLCAEALPGEKPEQRLALVRALATGVGPEDQALLESCLKDRSEAVREAAGELLCRLECALADQVRTLALRILPGDGTIHLPEALPPELPFSRKQAHDFGPKASLAWQVIRHVPPDLVARPDQLPSFKDEPWLLHALGHALDAWPRPGFAEPLWDLGVAARRRYVAAGHLDVPARETRVLQGFARGADLSLLPTLPAPWSTAVGLAWMGRVRAQMSGVSGVDLDLVRLGSAGLPDGLAAHALQMVAEPIEVKHFPQRQLVELLSSLEADLRLRGALLLQIQRPEGPGAP